MLHVLQENSPPPPTRLLKRVPVLLWSLATAAIIAFLLLAPLVRDYSTNAINKIYDPSSLFTIGVFLVSVLALPIRRRIAIAFVILINLVALRLYGLDVSALIGLVYLGLISLSGLPFARRFGSPLALAIAFVAGASIHFLAFVSVWTAIHPGFHVYFAVSLMLAALGSSYAFIVKSKNISLKDFGLDYLKIVYFALPVFVLGLTSTGSFPPSDSYWYAFNFDSYYNITASFFSGSPAIAPVHYYGKFNEVLMLPLFSFNDYATLAALSSGMVVFLSLPLAQLLRSVGISGRFRPAVVNAILCSPAILFTMKSITPDTIGLTFFALAIFIFAEVFRLPKQEGAMLGYPATPLFVTLSVKPFWIPVSVPLLAVLAVLFVFRLARRYRPSFKELVFVALGIAVFSATLLRNYFNLGYPIVGPNEVIDLLNLLGFRPTDTFAIAEMITAKNMYYDFYNTIFDLLTHSRAMYIVWIAWPSSIMLALAILYVSLAIGGRARLALTGNAEAIAVALTILLPVSYMLFRMIVGPLPNYGGSGWYFNMPYIAVPLALGLLVSIRISKAARRVVVSLAFLFASANAVVALVSLQGSSLLGAQWNFAKPPFRSHDFLEATLNKVGLGPVAEELAKHKQCQALAELSRGEPPVPWMYYALPCFVETSTNVTWPKRVGRRVFDSSATFREFACTTRLNYLITHNASRTYSDFFAQTFKPGELTPVLKTETVELIGLNRDLVCANAKPAS